MWALSEKIALSIVAQTADIPTLSWSGSGKIYILFVFLIKDMLLILVYY